MRLTRFAHISEKIYPICEDQKDLNKNKQNINSSEAMSSKHSNWGENVGNEFRLTEFFTALFLYSRCIHVFTQDTILHHKHSEWSHMWTMRVGQPLEFHYIKYTCKAAHLFLLLHHNVFCTTFPLKTGGAVEPNLKHRMLIRMCTPIFIATLFGHFIATLQSTGRHAKHIVMGLCSLPWKWRARSILLESTL